MHDHSDEHNFERLSELLKDTTPENRVHYEATFFETLLDAIPDCVQFKDTSLRYLLVNKAWIDRRNVTDRNSVIGKRDKDFLPSDIAEQFSQDEQSVITTKTAFRGKEYFLQFPEKAPLWITTTCVPIFSPDHKHVIAICSISRDISSTTKTEQELKYERDMLHMLLDNSHDAIYFKDLKSRYLRISKAHPALAFIDTPEQAIGKTDFDYFPEEHARKAFSDEQDIITTGKPKLGIVERETALGMPEKWVFTSKLPMFDNNNSIIGTFGISRDITRIKQYENELQKAKLELEERVSIRTKDLETANRKLEQRIAQLDFLTHASFEMSQCVEITDLASVIQNSFTSRLGSSPMILYIRQLDAYHCISVSADFLSGTNDISGENAVVKLNADTLSRPKVFSRWKDFLSENHPWTRLYHYSYLVAIPLVADKRHVGMLLIWADDYVRQQYKEEEKVILTLAAHAAVSLSNAIYLKELSEKAQLQGELDAARSIQQRLTPDFIPSIPRMALKGLYSPAYEVGGDYLDYFQNDADCWVVVVADVCGKGIPAALLMTLLRSAFRVESRFETSARNLLCSVNSSMQTNLDDRSFVTAICLIINPDGTRMSYARAGHPRLIRIDGEKRTVESYNTDGIALGIIPDRDTFADSVDELMIPLIKGDQFFIYTDGLTEAFNLQKLPYGMERLLQVLNRNDSETPEELLHTIIKDMKAFTQGAPYHDDLTLIALSVTD